MSTGEYEEGTLGWWMDQRRADLDLTWREVARRAGVPVGTLMRNAKSSAGIQTRTARKIERALRWKQGSVAAINRGEAPTPEDESAPIYRPTTGQVDRAAAVKRLIDLVPTVRRTEGDEAAEQLKDDIVALIADPGLTREDAEELRRSL